AHAKEPVFCTMIPMVIGVIIPARLLAKLMMLPLIPTSCLGAISEITTQLVDDMPCAKNENDRIKTTSVLDSMKFASTIVPVSKRPMTIGILRAKLTL